MQNNFWKGKEKIHFRRIYYVYLYSILNKRSFLEVLEEDLVVNIELEKNKIFISAGIDGS